MIIGVMNIYNDAGIIETALKSIRPHVDRLIVVDGAYADFPHTFPYSTDGTLDIVKKYADRIITCPKGEPWESEMVKRSAYLLGTPDDWYFMLDADEEFEGNLETLKSSSETDYNMPFVYEEDGGRKGKQYRLFRHREGLIYAKNHYSLYVGTQNLSDLVRPMFEQGIVYHRPQLRSSEREEAKKKYYAVMRSKNQI